MPHPIARVALNTPLYSVFDYRNPRFELEAGMRVAVNFGRRKEVGIVIETSEHSALAAEQIKPISEVIDGEACVSKSFLEFVQWAARYYHHPVGEALFHALPARLREQQALHHKDVMVWQTTEKGSLYPPDKLGKAIRQIEALQELKKHAQGIGNKALQASGITLNSLQALEKKGLVQQVALPRKTRTAQDAAIHTLRSSPLTLNAEQTAATQRITESFGQFGSFLLHGITGSGKTEVYMHCVQACLEQGRQALILVPEIGLTPQTLQRFQQRFTCKIAVLHSGLGETERFKNWYMARQNQAGIVIGTRSAIFADLPEPGLIIVDEEHDLSYKQQEGFRYSARDLAVVRAKDWNIPVILGSATPSLESLHNCEQGRYQRLPLSERATQGKLPTIRVDDIRGKELQAGLSHNSLHHIRKHLEQHRQVLVFINRRGYTPALVCPECNWLATCPYCDARFTYHKSRQLLLCHHCNFRQAPIKTCPKCHEGNLLALGQGTEKVEELLALHFKKTPILRIDRDSTSQKNAFAEHLKIITSGTPCILVGTQMLTKGHHFPKVSLVCILECDQGFFSADFRAMERMGQTLIQIIGRAGREDDKGEIVLQTQLPDHPQLQSLIKQDYQRFAAELLADRKALNFPPFGMMALLRADAPHIETSMEFLHSVKQLCENAVQPKILGPTPASMQRKAGRHRAQLLFLAHNRHALHSTLNQIITHIAQLPLARKVRWSIDVDPQESF